ncbi:MAG: hypothetical protein EOP93_01600 [Lysobacteraceae bacterium]|nr:MAG: hypothetical protein EOP93_01600 [Xanthomonadaceae bacterium]
MSLRRFLRLAPKALLAIFLVAGIGVAVLLGPYALRVRHVEADAGKGFHADYYLYVPPSLHHDAAGLATLLVQPNNSGRTSDDIASHRRDAWMTGFERKRIADELGVALLVPAFPRTASDWRVYTHALDRDVLTTRNPALARLDLQLIAMIDDARARLRRDGTPLDARVLLQGFSASAMFANRFTALHPRRVRAVTVGSPGGWPIAPVAKAGVDPLPYPAGIADLATLTGRPFDAAAFARVPQYLYMGADDDNDSLDFEDGWDKPMSAEVDRLFGDTPKARWKQAEALYAQAGANARFELVAGVRHDRKALQERSTAFFRQVLATPAP